MEKERNLNAVLSEADKLFSSGDLTNAQKKYEEARKIDYTNTHAKNRLNEIKETRNVEMTSQNNETSDWSDYNKTSDNNSQSNTNSSNYSSSNNSGSNSNTNYTNAQLINDIQRLDNITQTNNQIISNLAVDLGSLAYMAFASDNALKEGQRRQREEEERIRLEEERKEREIEMAWNTMTDFEQKFSGNFKKDFYSVTNWQCVYFYFGSITKTRYNKSGSMKFSNIFPVYAYSDGSWPYMSDITNKIKSAYGDVQVRGYFLSGTEAQKDMNDAVSAARKSYFKYINLNAYNFTFNESSGSTSSNKDFWGKEESGKKTESGKDFWGNESNTTNTTNNIKNLNPTNGFISINNII